MFRLAAIHHMLRRLTHRPLPALFSWLVDRKSLSPVGSTRQGRYRLADGRPGWHNAPDHPRDSHAQPHQQDRQRVVHRGQQRHGLEGPPLPPRLVPDLPRARRRHRVFRDRGPPRPQGGVAEGGPHPPVDRGRGVPAHQDRLRRRAGQPARAPGRQPGGREAGERLPRRGSGHRGGHTVREDRLPGVPEGQVPRQGLPDPRPAGSRRVVRPGRVVQLHPARADRGHRAERPDHRPAGERPPGVVRAALVRTPRT